MNIIRFLFSPLVMTILVFFPSPVFAKEKPLLRVGVLKSSPPYSFINAETRIVRGFSVDLAKMLSKKMGADVVFYAKSKDRLLRELRAGKLDMISGLMITPGTEKHINHIDTDVKIKRRLFVNTAYVTITCEKDLPGTLVALEQGRNINTLINDPSKIRFIEANSHVEALEKVNRQEAHVYISNAQLTSLYFIQKNNFENIKEVGLPLNTVYLSLAVHADNTELLTKLSFTYGKILETGSYRMLKEKWFGHNIEFIDWEYYFKLVFIVIGVIAIVLAAIILWNLFLKRKVSMVTESLKQSEQKYRDLIESSPEMIHLIAADGSIIHANKIAQKNLEFEESQIGELKLYDFVLEKQRKEAEAFLQSVFADGYGYKELCFATSCGNKIPVEIVATTVNELNNSPSHICCFSRDLTKRKQLEAGLLQSERLATMGRMAAGIAHEINNPLGIIAANAEDIMDYDPKSEDLQESLKSIRRNAVRAGKILEDLLTFTRPRPIRMARFNLHETILSSLKFLSQKLKKRNIKVLNRFCCEDIYVNGDENLMQHLLLNLFINSMEAINGSGVIEIHTNCSKKNDRDVVYLEIKDSGIGIPVEDTSKLFDPFFSVGKKKGFGLGLFISKQIAEIHDGELAASRMSGKGTKMSLEIPLNR